MVDVHPRTNWSENCVQGNILHLMAKKQSDLIVIAVHNHNPKEDDDLQIKEIVSSAPDLFAQLPVQRGEKFDVLGRHVGWWLYVQHLGGSGKGYIPSTCVVPLKDNLTNEEWVNSIHTFVGTALWPWWKRGMSCSIGIVYASHNVSFRFKLVCVHFSETFKYLASCVIL